MLTMNTKEKDDYDSFPKFDDFEVLPLDSMQYRLNKANIETIRSECGNPYKVKLCFNGKTIFRPNVESCPNIVKNAFGLII